MEACSKLVCGKNACKEVLNFAPETVKELWLCQKDNEKAKGKHEFEELAHSKGIKFRYLSKQRFQEILGTSSHQGVALSLRSLSFEKTSDFLEKSEKQKESLVLMFDSIFDPQNFGALLRVCETYACDAVVWSKNRGAGLTPTVHKASVGASIIVPKLLVSNLVDTCKKFKQAGYWVVLADVNEESQALSKFEFPEKTLLIMGSEGKGIQSSLKKQADFSVYIPMLGQIDSLNVSQATACFVYENRRQKGKI